MRIAVDVDTNRFLDMMGNGTLRWDGNTVWYAGSSAGDGSGLHANLVDGLHTTQLLRSDTDSETSGNLTREILHVGREGRGSSSLPFRMIARAPSGHFSGATASMAGR